MEILADKQTTIEKKACIAYITLMSSLSDKLLAVILALLLGFSPLQATVAAVVDNRADDAEMHQMVEQSGDTHNMMSHQMGHDCQHQMDGGCQSHAGTSHHCASCVVGLPSAIAFHPTATATSGLRPSNERFSSRHTTSLYRPPRA